MKSYGVQLYSIRDVANNDLRLALKTASDIGYKFVEFAGFFGNDASDVRRWLCEYGLEVSGTHTGCDMIKDEVIDQTIAYHKAIGCNRLIVPGAGWATEAEMESNLSLFREAGKKLMENGIRLGYHNHSAEFHLSGYGKVIEDEIINRTDMELEIDVFWLFNAGIDPVPYLEAHKDRISVIHLKDGIRGKGESSFENSVNGAEGRYLGLGEVPIKEICDWADRNGVLIVVESEDLNPSGSEEIAKCMEYLQSLDV